MKKVDNVQVVVRVRPLNQQEIKSNSRLSICTISDDEILVESKPSENISAFNTYGSISKSDSASSQINVRVFY